MTNNLLLPSILGATILLAGIFAVMPVEKASTVHTTILANTLELKTIRCAETTNIDDTNDDGDYTLDLPAGSSNMIVVDIQLEGGAADPPNANNAITIDEILVDNIQLGSGTVNSLAQTLYDATPTEGSIKQTLGVGKADYYANDTVRIDVVAVDSGEDDVDYTIVFFYLAPGNDADAICTPTLA